MAHNTLAVPHPAHFHSVFDRVIERQMRAVDRIMAQVHLGSCEYVYCESSRGANDHQPCGSRCFATDLLSRLTLCEYHFTQSQPELVFERDYCGWYVIDRKTYDCELESKSPVGRGKTQGEALADYFEQMEVARG